MMPTNTEITNALNEWCHNARHREATRIRMTDGLSYGEIADRMHVDERTAKRYVQRGKASIEGHI